MYVKSNVLCMLSMYFSLRQIYLQFKRFLQSLFSFSKKKNQHKAYICIYKKKNKNYLFHSRVFLSTFLSLRIYLNNNNNNSGRDIICFPPNALFISGRDFVQSFESRHGRHGNSNLVMLFVSERNNHWSKQKNKEIIYWLSTYIIAAAVTVLSAPCNRSSKNTKCCAIIINRWFFFF